MRRCRVSALPLKTRIMESKDFYVGNVLTIDGREYTVEHEETRGSCEGCALYDLPMTPACTMCMTHDVILKLKLPRVYISGAISGHDIEERKCAFAKRAESFKRKGFKAVSFLDNGLSQDASYEAHMRADIALMLTCDSVYMMEGWQNSRGAKMEHDVAEICGLEIFYEKEE